jgi:hypothetical protein
LELVDDLQQVITKTSHDLRKVAIATTSRCSLLECDNVINFVGFVIILQTMFLASKPRNDEGCRLAEVGDGRRNDDLVTRVKVSRAA